MWGVNSKRPITTPTEAIIMSELGRQLFLKSRDQYEAAVRWASVLVVIGIAVHATIFSRAVEIQKELHTKQTALENLSSMPSRRTGWRT